MREKIPKQALTLDSTGGVISYGRTPLVPKAGETLHMMQDFTAPNDDSHRFWIVENGYFVAMTGTEKDAAISEEKDRRIEDLGDSGSALDIDWSSSSLKKVNATDDASISMTTSVQYTEGRTPSSQPDVLILIVRNQGGDLIWDWPTNTFWMVDSSIITTGLNIFRFERFNDYYLGSRHCRF